MGIPEDPTTLWISAFIGWSSIYLTSSYVIKKVFRNHDYLTASDIGHFAEGIVSIVQGFFCGGVGVVTVAATRHDIMNAKHWFTVPYSTIGSAYFIYDLIAMYYSHSKQPDSKGLPWKEHFKLYLHRNSLMVAHHIILIFLLFPALVYYSGMGDFFTGCFYLTEISTPFVNMRVILSKFGLKSSKLYILNGVMMTVVFALCRVVMFPFMYMSYLQQAAEGAPMYTALAK